MTYGQDSTSASYEDSGLWADTQDQSQVNPQQAQQAQESQIPAFDPNKFVPIEKFNQIEQELGKMKPIYEALHGVSNQQPQLSPEEKSTQDFLTNHFQTQAKAQGFMSKAEFQEALELRDVGKWAESRGIGDEVDADLFYQSTFRRLQRDSASNPNLNNIANNMATLYSNKQYSQLTKYLDTNLPKQYWNGANSQPQAQTVGQSFSNQPFGGSNELTPDNFTAQVTQLQRAGKWQEAQALQQKFAQQIKSIY